MLPAIGSVSRESLDNLIVFGEAHLRGVLKAYASYYNEVRTHLSLNKNSPDFESPARQSLFSPRDEARLHYLACARQLSEKAESVFDGFEEISAKRDRRENIIGELHLNHLQR